MNRYITLRQLRREGACLYERELFEERFGRRVVITEKRCADNAADFSWCWAARRLLVGRQNRVYDKAIVKPTAALRAVRRILDTAKDRRLEALGTLRAITHTGAGKPINELDIMLRSEYNARFTEILGKFKTANAIAFAKAYNSRK